MPAYPRQLMLPSARPASPVLGGTIGRSVAVATACCCTVGTGVAAQFTTISTKPEAVPIVAVTRTVPVLVAGAVKTEMGVLPGEMVPGLKLPPPLDERTMSWLATMGLPAAFRGVTRI